MNETILELRGITKQYPGSIKKANNNINLNLNRGEILCLIGENGAGKTTLMKILLGLHTPDEGNIFINGKKVIINTPIVAKNLKIGMVHQHFMLFRQFTVAENIVMGMEPLKFRLFFDKKKATEIAKNIIDEHGFSIDVSQKIMDLSPGQMQQAEICRILYRDAQIIILDEPTSILTEQETFSLFNTLKKLVSNGKSVILVTHKINEIKGNCSRIAILQNGELKGIRNADEINEYEIAQMMSPQNIPEIKRINTNLSSKKNEPVISFKNVTVKRKDQKLPLLDNLSFTVHSNEILGFTGVGGNGLGVIEAVLGGFLHPADGTIMHKKNDITNYNIRSLRKQGLSYVPSDRINVGSAQDATIKENFIINSRFVEFSDEIIKKFNIEGAHEKNKCRTLSGGNLQKLILARELSCFKDYIVFCEPSWGLDMGSSRFIYSEIEKIRNDGAAVILISTNLEEILYLADRIIVMYKGRAAAQIENTGDILIKNRINVFMQGLVCTE